MTNNEVAHRPRTAKPIEWYVERVDHALRGIVNDVRSGRIPGDIGCFSDLNNYVDDDCSDGIRDFFDEINDSSGSDKDSAIAATDIVQEMVDAWIRSGGIAMAIAADQHRQNVSIRR